MGIGGEPIPGAVPVEVAKPTTPILTNVKTESSSTVKIGSDVREIKEELLNPRVISKKNDPEGRKKMVQTILDTKKEKKLQEIADLTSSLYQEQQHKAEELTQRLKKIVVKIKGFAGISDKEVVDLQTQLDEIEKRRTELQTQSSAIESELGDNRHKGEIPTSRQLLEAYYDRMSTEPLTNEQKRNLLKPEVLASLSEQEYISLLRRLNPYFVSHVTRQGFRDHNAMFYHSAGLQEYHNGFVGVMQDGKLIRPPMALGELKTRDEDSVRRWLGDWILGEESEAKAKEKLNNLLHFHLASAPKYPDQTAVHFATQLVADAYYGGERENEVFFVFPSDFVASQYNFSFNGWEKDFTRPQSETKWNDVFVWPNTVDNPGITVDAGLVFLPENTPVDPNTGSKYASEIKIVDGKEQRVMVEDAALIETFIDWGQKIDDQSPLKQAFQTYKEERNYYSQQYLSRNLMSVCMTELQGLGFRREASVALADALVREMHYSESFNNELLTKIIRESGAHWKRAENTVPAKEYWENFFRSHPDLRPKHINYYDGDPTTAVREFQQQNDIGKADTSEKDGQLLGFDDHHVTDMDKDPRSNMGYEELVATANKIITEHFSAARNFTPLL
ncbi:hypothetical protein GYA28_03320 [Candidatus Roizmanbacteria bacterium]|nr:hypothetical protein [Candidatus Roizmanbacteria bacterium]